MAVVLGLVMAVAALWLGFWRAVPGPAARAAGQPAPAAPVAAAAPMVFARTGANAEVLAAVERVCGPENAQVSLVARGAARWLCIVVQEGGRYYALDEGLTPQDFPALARGEFTAPPEPILRTMSIYRSLAKTALGNRADRGDRIVVLLCPKPDWPGLHLSWPP